MKKYCVFEQGFELKKKVFCFPANGFIFEQLADVPQKMNDTFLFGESSDFASVSAPKVADDNPTIVFSEVVDRNLRFPAFVNMKKDNIRIGEYPQPVALPPGFIF